MTQTVERCALAQDLSISRVLTGLWQIADLERDGRSVDLTRAAESMESYIAAGLSTFDMADHYGSAELVAGTLRKRRESSISAELLTKWVPKPGPVTREDARTAVVRALDRVHSRTIDLMQFHTWSYADPSWLDALFYLQELKREGLIRHIGLTNFDTAHLRIAIASGIDVVSNQISFSLLDRRAMVRMAEYCLAHGVKLLAYGTLAGGWLSDRWLDRDEPDWERTGTWSQMKYGRFLRVTGGWDALQRLLRVLSRVAKRHDVSIANVASRYILEHRAVGGVIIGARLGERDHIDDTLRLFRFSLTEGDRGEIESVLATLNPMTGDVGDEYRKPPFLTASGDLSHHFTALPSPYPVRQGADGRSYCLSGTPWESFAGYARAVRHGQRVFVSGTTAAHGDKVIGGDDPAAQAHFVIDKIEGALQSLGGRLDNVVRTRVYVPRHADWEAVARVHGERFGGILPANTLVITGLVGAPYLVEIEAEAEVPADDPLRE